MSPGVTQRSPPHFGDLFLPHSSSYHSVDGLQSPLQVPWSRFQPKSSASPVAALQEDDFEIDPSWNAESSRDHDVSQRLLEQQQQQQQDMGSLPDVGSGLAQMAADLPISPAALFLSAFSPSPSTLGLSAPSADPPDAEGQIVAGYTLGPVIGYGGFSIIRSASSPSGGSVAIKIVKRSDLNKHENPALARRELDHEASVWSSLSHEHILPLFSSEHTAYADFFVMLHCPAGSLFDILKRDGRPALPHDDAGTMFRQVVRGVRYLHESAGYVHRDLKLENVLVDEMGVCRITDFGMARRIDEGESAASGLSSEDDEDELQQGLGQGLQRHRSANVGRSKRHAQKAGLPVHHLSLMRHHGSGQQPRRQTTIAGGAAAAAAGGKKQTYQSGSLPYAAPELLSHARAQRAHPAQDMWALGVLLYALLTGRLPFADAFEPRLQMKILHGAYEMPQGIGRGAERVIRGCLEPSVRSRWTIAMVDEMAWGVGWGEVDDGSPCDERDEDGEDEEEGFECTSGRSASQSQSRSRSRVHQSRRRHHHHVHHHHHVPHTHHHHPSHPSSRNQSRADSQSRLPLQMHGHTHVYPQDSPAGAAGAAMRPARSVSTSASDATSCSLSTRSTSTSTSRSASRPPPASYHHPLLSPRSRERTAPHGLGSGVGGRGEIGIGMPFGLDGGRDGGDTAFAGAYASPEVGVDVSVVTSPAPSALSASALSVERGRGRKMRKAGANNAKGSRSGSPSPSPLAMPLALSIAPRSIGEAPVGVLMGGSSGRGGGGAGGAGMSPLSPPIRPFSGSYGGFFDRDRERVGAGEAEDEDEMGAGVRDERDVSRGRTRTTPSARFVERVGTANVSGAPAPVRRAESTPPAPSVWPAPPAAVAMHHPLKKNKSVAPWSWSSRNASATFLREPSLAPTAAAASGHGCSAGLKGAPSVATATTTAYVEGGTKSTPIDIQLGAGTGAGPLKVNKIKMAARSRSVGFEAAGAAAFRT